MIRGIGVDLIEIERIAQAIRRRGRSFINRLFTSREQIKDTSEEYLSVHYSGKFAAKEAVVKAFGTGFRGIDWKDIEILKDPLGKPLVFLSSRAEQKFQELEPFLLMVTITHSKTHACAVCLWQDIDTKS